MASYCTVTQARAAGATGDDTRVAAAIVAASARVDRYTRTLWDQRSLTVAAQVGAAGRALLPLPVVSVSAVALEGVATPYSPGSYRVTSSSTPGQVDAVLVGAAPLDWTALATVVPAAPRRSSTVLITGVFGRPEVPADVQEATALVAAAITLAGAGGTGGSAVNVEGDVDLPPRVGTIGQADSDDARSTGVAAADELLRPARRNLVRLG